MPSAQVPAIKPSVVFQFVILSKLNHQCLKNKPKTKLYSLSHQISVVCLLYTRPCRAESKQTNTLPAFVDLPSDDLDTEQGRRTKGHSYNLYYGLWWKRTEITSFKS